jgi:hypothetical protein
VSEREFYATNDFGWRARLARKTNFFVFYAIRHLSIIPHATTRFLWFIVQQQLVHSPSSSSSSTFTSIQFKL